MQLRTVAPQFGAQVTKFEAPSVNEETKDRFISALTDHTASNILHVSIVQQENGIYIEADDPRNRQNLEPEKTGLPYFVTANVYNKVGILVKGTELLAKLQIILHVLGVTAKKEGVTAKKEEGDWTAPIIFEGKNLGTSFIDLTT